MADEADMKLSLPFQMFDGEEGDRRDRGEAMEVTSIKVDTCFRSFVGTGVERVSGPETRLPGESW